jgi:hypothetical protein
MVDRYQLDARDFLLQPALVLTGDINDPFGQGG